MKKMNTLSRLIKQLKERMGVKNLSNKNTRVNHIPRWMYRNE